MTTVYGFFYNSCVYESASALVSLHETKRAAYKAMRKAKFEAAMIERDTAISYGGKWFMKRKTLEGQWYGIQAIEVKREAATGEMK